ncbi:hypothetical protein IH980_04325 [Patescibacteria group bacterium]|nr:hypothetical protein [Patescibacteria group bacterium]
MVATDLEERINQSTDQLTPDIEDAISRLATAEARYAWAKITKEKRREGFLNQQRCGQDGSSRSKREIRKTGSPDGPSEPR